MVEYALETILNLVESGNGDPNDLGLQFSEIFLKKADNVVLVLGCLEVSVYCNNVQSVYRDIHMYIMYNKLYKCQNLYIYEIYTFDILVLSTLGI